MKKILFVALFLTLGTLATQAQGGGGFQRYTVEDRVKIIHYKMDSAFKPAADKMKQIDTVFAWYYRAELKFREDMMSNGERPDQQAVRVKRQLLTDERDGELKKILTEEQYKKWKEEIEPSMRPQRGPRQ